MPRVALTIGNFDGVHLGHRALVARARHAVDTPRERGRVVAMAFDPHPFTKLRPEAAPPRLSTWPTREHALQEAGADDVVRLTPDDATLTLPAEDFVRGIVDRYRPIAIVEGEDFHFGRARSGNVSLLSRMGQTLAFDTIVVPPVEVDLSDQLIARASSSLCRWLIAHARVADAARVLGRPYQLEGEVTQGDRRGRTVAFPTANLSTTLLLPADGVYAAEALLPDGRTHLAAVNIGTRPTFAGLDRRVEAHLIDLPQTPSSPAIPGLPEYGWPLTLRLLAFVRDQVRFESVGALVAQLHRDVARVRRLAGSALVPTPPQPSAP